MSDPNQTATTTTEAAATTAATEATAATGAEQKPAETTATTVETKPETKTEEKKPVKGDDTKAKPFEVSEIKFADGVEVDPALAGEFTSVVNEHGIPRSAVSALLALQEKSMKAASETGSALWSKTQDTWMQEVKSDPEIGGEKWAQVSASIGQVLDKYGSPEVRAAYDLTGAGNNPHITRMMAKIAKVLTEPGFIPASPGGGPALSAADRLYPNQSKT